MYPVIPALIGSVAFVLSGAIMFVVFKNADSKLADSLSLMMIVAALFLIAAAICFK